MREYILGIDTSNYTTSMAVVDKNENLIWESRKLLDVKEGERGLRQSDALFQHVINMPSLFKEFNSHIENGYIEKVCVSSKPRPLEGSYMPVFRAGQAFGETIALILNCEYLEVSHQENHIKAALWSILPTKLNNFIAVHLSGGTTEILKVEDKYLEGYEVEIVGGTKDISAGQLIDRIGVKLGFPFPAGKHMDTYILSDNEVESKLPISVKYSYINFSGTETAAQRLIEKEDNKNSIAKGVFHSVARSLEKAVLHACKETNLKQVLFMGGVASSSYISNYLNRELYSHGIHSYFGNPMYCTDNAVGTALLGAMTKK